MLKRLFDVLMAGLLLVAFMPIFLAVSLLILVKLGFPVFFIQRRPGYLGIPFDIYKFRTMNNMIDQHGNPLPDSDRLTRFGSFIRSTSLDELPCLLNVLKGEMSLVGPRPLLMEYLPLYNDYQKRRHEVRPGVTGWAQVNGRNTISWNEKFKFDIWYVENQSFLLDVKILLLTFKKVILRDGITKNGEVTTSKFTGNNRS